MFEVVNAKTGVKKLYERASWLWGFLSPVVGSGYCVYTPALIVSASSVSHCGDTRNLKPCVKRVIAPYFIMELIPR